MMGEQSIGRAPAVAAHLSWPEELKVMAHLDHLRGRVASSLGRAAFTSMRCWATCSAEHPRTSLPKIQAFWPLKRETPLEAGFRHSGSAYLPPGQTSCEAGAHLAGFCAHENCKSEPVV